MNQSIILDTGVLIAFLMPKDKFHQWAVAQLSEVSCPILTINEKINTDIYKKIISKAKIKP